MDLYTNSKGSDRCRVSPFPDLEKTIKFDRPCCCTPCHGFLMYMNIVSTTKVDGSLEDKLCVWRLQSEGWQLISQISLGSIFAGGFNYAPMMINPFDAKTAYFWREKEKSLLYINLHNGKYVIYNQFELTSDGRTMIPTHDPRAVISLKKYMHRPCPVRSSTMVIDHGFYPLLPMVFHYPVADVMPVLLKSGQSASQEEAVEKRNICRSMKNS
ncbi:hypothetical protein F2Q70_00038423 [Brassica cretica]|uniref:F-box protein At3g26010-like beta-propeller domain-containing protein n=1 Tax=Brassica cretica TaxID=69181 RepID=A0A8S9K799_BRACR|nr:hypothetical protein F2Q70_00038423 [Brassica cretica]